MDGLQRRDMATSWGRLPSAPVARVALATCAELPEMDSDERLVLEPLRALGVDVRPAVWDDPTEDWDAFDLVVVRSTWDYMHRLDEFLAWADRVPRLANSAAVLRWNTDKRYLAELADAGVATVPTVFLAPGDAYREPDGAAEVVVKPTVSGGSMHTARYAAGDPRAAAHVARLHSEGATAMVQPYLAGVDTAGETALLHLGGTYSHAIRKGPLLEAGAEPRTGPELSEDISPRESGDAERAVATTVMAELGRRFGPLLYARVDLVPGPDGAPVLIEVEITEPSLFLRTDADAPARLAEAIAAAAS